MTKKTLYLLLAFVGILIAGIVAAVIMLYSDKGKKSGPVRICEERFFWLSWIVTLVEWR